MLFLFYIVMMRKTIYFILPVFFLCSLNLVAQTDSIPVALHTIAEKRVKEYRNLVNNSITKNLSLKLTASTEEDWESAFAAMELLLYRTAWTDDRIRLAFDSIEKRREGFQRAAIELAYTMQNKSFETAVQRLMLQTGNSKVFAMCAEYLLLCNSNPSVIAKISKRAANLVNNSMDESSMDESSFAIISGLGNRLKEKQKPLFAKLDLMPFFEPDYLKGNIIIYSIQRKNRNYPGISIVRNKNGEFFADETGAVFSVPQLARSISNLPGYLTNGNTPQGIFRVDGFAISKSAFIGPTENIQLTMPNEYTPAHFMKDSSVTDTILTPAYYAKLVPEALKNYQPIYESYLAGKSGRTEIIAHGTAVNPAYYIHQPYYPLTPTQGCLSTREAWGAVDGKRTVSDQQKLVNAVKAAGGPDGYCIVIEMDDRQEPVSLHEILPYLKK